MGLKRTATTSNGAYTDLTKALAKTAFSVTKNARNIVQPVVNR